MFSTSILVFVVFLAYLQSAITDCPANAKIQDLTGNERTQMLAEHNKIRSQLSSEDMKCKIIQPRSQPLPVLQWDPELAKKACDVSKTCNMVPNLVEGEMKDKYGCVGQNLWLGTVDDDTANSAGAVGAWVDECNYYNVNNLAKNNFFKTAHWAQVVWSETKFVGCCKSTFTDPDDSKTKQLITCNYGPCGNKNGEAAYTPL